MMSPEVLVAAGVPCCRCRTHPPAPLLEERLLLVTDDNADRQKSQLILMISCFVGLSLGMTVESIIMLYTDRFPMAEH